MVISLSSCKWCWDRSGGSSTADETEGKLVLEIMKIVLVVVLVALPLVSFGGIGEDLEMGRVFDGQGGGYDIISIGSTRVNTLWGLKGRVGGSRYHTGNPSVKSCKLQVSKTGLLTILDGRKRKKEKDRVDQE